MNITTYTESSYCSVCLLFVSSAIVKDMMGDKGGSLSPCLSFAEEMKLLGCSAEVKTVASSAEVKTDSTDLRHVCPLPPSLSYQFIRYTWLNLNCNRSCEVTECRFITTDYPVLLQVTTRVCHYKTQIQTLAC